MRVHRKHIAVVYAGFENMLNMIRLKIIITILYFYQLICCFLLGRREHICTEASQMPSGLIIPFPGKSGLTLFSSVFVP